VTEQMTLTAMCTLQNWGFIADSLDDSSGEKISVFLYRPSSRLAMGKQVFAMMREASKEDVR